jgi:hypothetical protein
VIETRGVRQIGSQWQRVRRKADRVHSNEKPFLIYRLEARMMGTMCTLHQKQRGKHGGKEEQTEEEASASAV